MFPDLDLAALGTTFGALLAASLFLFFVLTLIGFRIVKITWKLPLPELEFARREASPPPPAGEGEGLRPVAVGSQGGGVNVADQTVNGPVAGSAPPPSKTPHYVRRGAVEAELLAALRQGAAAALCGVRGMGGVGKSELARHLFGVLKGERSEAAVWIDVSDRDPLMVQGDMAAALGHTLPEGLDEAGRHRFLTGLYEHKPRVLFLDDVPARFPLHHCLPPSPPCAVLVTSRHREWPELTTHDLDVMTEGEARELLRGHADAQPLLERESAAEEQLIAACSRHPLALTLAARLLAKGPRGATPVADLVARLDNRMAELRSGEGVNGSLEATFDLSYGRLSPEAQGCFRALALFSGAAGFTEAAAAHLWGVEPRAARKMLEGFVDASLVNVHGSAARWLLHDLLRDYAEAKLNTAAGERERHEAALEAWLLGLFEHHTLGDLSTAPHVAPELENLRLAFEAARRSGAGARMARLATVARNWLGLLSLWPMWDEWLRATLAAGIGDVALEANTLQAIGDVQQFRKEQAEALKSYGEALRLFREVGDRLGEANTRKAIGDVQRFRAENEEALKSYGEALRLFREVGSRLGEANTLQAIGDVQQFRKEQAEALKSYGEALRLFREVGSRLGEANTLQAIGDVQQFRKEQAEALKSYGEALRLFREVGDRLGEANTRKSIGDVQQFRKEQAEALKSYGEALRLFREVGDRLGEANALQAIGDVQRFRAENEEALKSYGEALRLFREVGDRLGEANTRKAIGDVQRFRAENEEALKSYGEALRLFREVGDRLGEANALQAIGDVQRFRAENEEALKSYGEALRLFREVGSRLGEANTRLGMAQLLGAGGRGAEALPLFEEAIGLFTVIGDRYSTARGKAFYGYHLLGGEGVEKGAQLLGEAEALFRQIGLAPQADQLAALLAEMPGEWDENEMAPR